MDWRYPTASLPLRLGCISLDMTYNEVSAYDVLWFASHTILGAKVCLRSVVSDRMGEPAGRAITAVDTVYVALFSSAVGFLAIGWLARSSLRNGCLAFAAVSPGGRKRVRRTKLRHRRRNSPPPLLQPKLGDTAGWSDSGSVSSNAPAVLAGRPICISHCLRPLGRQSGALRPTLCSGKRAKPATALYDDGLIQHGERVRNANSLCQRNCAPHIDWIIRVASLKISAPTLGVGVGFPPLNTGR